MKQKQKKVKEDAEEVEKGVREVMARRCAPNGNGGFLLRGD